MTNSRARGIERVVFRNICYEGVGENPSQIKGLDKNRMVRDVVFENVVMNGKKLDGCHQMKCNEFIENVSFK